MPKVLDLMQEHRLDSIDRFLLLLPRVVLHQSLLTNRMKLFVGDQLAERLTELGGQLVALDSDPVSYTHLDVYKRQCL